MLLPRWRNAGVYRVAIPALLVPGLFCLLFASRGAGLEPQPFAATPGSAAVETARGSTLYRQECISCHGRDGRGTRARQSRPEIPDFTSPAWHRRHSDVQMRVTIFEGKGTGMPAFGDKLDEERCRELILYLRTFAPQRPARVEAVPGDFERQFRALQEELSTLRRQFEELSSLPDQHRAARGRVIDDGP